MSAPQRLRLGSLVGALGFGALAGATVVGCTTTGGGAGESPNGDVRVNFTWKQSAPTAGTLAATVTSPNGVQQQYAGKFYQITRDTRAETIAPVWSIWYPGWRGWAFWGPNYSDAFIEHYSGHVVANLSAPDGKRMRCRILLLRSGQGLKGGGEGECQLPSGQTVNVDFAPA